MLPVLRLIDHMLCSEQRDLVEIDRCQRELWDLYSHGLRRGELAQRAEFTAYRIIYLLYTRNHAGKPIRAPPPLDAIFARD